MSLMAIRSLASWIGRSRSGTSAAPLTISESSPFTPSARDAGSRRDDTPQRLARWWMRPWCRLYFSARGRSLSGIDMALGESCLNGNSADVTRCAASAVRCYARATVHTAVRVRGSRQLCACIVITLCSRRRASAVWQLGRLSVTVHFIWLAWMMSRKPGLLAVGRAAWRAHCYL